MQPGLAAAIWVAPLRWMASILRVRMAVAISGWVREYAPPAPQHMPWSSSSMISA